MFFSSRKVVRSTTASEFSPEVAMSAKPEYPVRLARAHALGNNAKAPASQPRLVMKKKSQAFENKTLVEHCGSVYTYVTLGVNPQNSYSGHT
jgi:hypothetical protein